MTSATTTRTATGSINPTLAPLAKVGKSPEPGWLLALARRWGKTPATTKKDVFHLVFARVEEAVEEMLADGRRDLVALRCSRLDAIRVASYVSATTAEHKIALHDNFERDSRENPATSAHAMEMTPASWDTARRLLVLEVNAKLALIRSGDSLYREGV